METNIMKAMFFSVIDFEVNYNQTNTMEAVNNNHWQHLEGSFSH